jgi:hypothetical protein
VPEFNQNQFLNILSSTYSHISGVPSIWLGARKNAMSASRAPIAPAKVQAKWLRSG